MDSDDVAPAVDVEALRALAAGVAVNRALEVATGPPGCGWCIDTHTGRIQVDPDDLEALPAEEIYGLTCHEAAHAALTRYPWLVPGAVLAEPGVRALLNALEDCRIESWLLQRLPGAAPWIHAYNSRLFPEDPFVERMEEIDAPPLFWQFCVACLNEWWHGERPRALDSRVVAALERTVRHRRAVVAAIPAAAAETLDVRQVQRYRASRIARVFAPVDGLVPPDGTEVAVRLAAAQAWSTIWSHILPVYRELVAEDAPERVAQAEDALLAQLRDVSGWAREVRLARPVRGSGRESSDPDEAARQAAIDPPVQDSWEDARRDVLPMVDTLVDDLLRILRPRALPRWVAGFSTGQRVDLRNAMQAQARFHRAHRVPRALGRHCDPYRDLWERKTLPERADPRFLLLLDLSGSMRGDPIHWGFRGTVLLAEVLERLAVPYAVYGFQDRLLPFKPFAMPLDRARGALSQMPEEVTGSRPDGHNRPEHNWDGPVLAAAAATLMDDPCRTPVLIVVSDGEPSGPADAAGALHRAIAGLHPTIHLIGLGLGPGTQHVRRFYPNAVAEVPLEAFPTAIGHCIRTALLGSPQPARRPGGPLESP
jgi:hypothetical protein